MAARMLVRDYMVRQPTTLRPETELMQAVHILVANRISGAPVVTADGSLVGMLTEKDCLRIALNASYYSEYGGTVAEVMTTAVETMEPDLSMVDAAKRFLAQDYKRYPVLEDGQLVGQLSRSDVMRALGDAWR